MFAQTPKICYEIFIRSFCDSNQDGIGDLNGICSKLNYLHELGVEAIWISPFCKSPSYHKYDVVNYTEIDKEYGTMFDFEKLITTAHSKNIKVYFDFIINHTSIQNEWFKEAAKGKDNPFRDYYLWMTPEKIEEMGIASRDKSADSGEINPWHWLNKNDSEKYYAMFWSGMPDLNMDNPKVRTEIFTIAKFWIDKGIDGFRMDAAKHIYPEWEANKNRDFWIDFKNHLEEIKPDIYIVGEVWTSAEKQAPFFKGLKANFNFDLSYAIQEIVKTGIDSTKIIKRLLSDYKIFAEENPNFITATMLSNHDQDRIGSVAEGNIEKLKMAANLLFTLPGQAYIYYGEELGMLGQKPDENIREAFLWNTRNFDKDRTNWRKPNYNTDSQVCPLELQKTKPESLYNHYKKMISLVKSLPALNQISPPNIEESKTENLNLISFIRPHQNGNLFVIQNISNQQVMIDIKEDIQQNIFEYNAKTLNQQATFESYGILIFQLK